MYISIYIYRCIYIYIYIYIYICTYIYIIPLAEKFKSTLGGTENPKALPTPTYILEIRKKLLAVW
jgi:hypothetical protein